MATNGSKLIADALTKKGFRGLSQVKVDLENTPARSNAPTSKIAFYSSLIPSKENFEKVHRIPVEFKTKDAVTGEFMHHKVVLQIHAKNTRIPKDTRTAISQVHVDNAAKPATFLLTVTS